MAYASEITRAGEIPEPRNLVAGLALNRTLEVYLLGLTLPCLGLGSNLKPDKECTMSIDALAEIFGFIAGGIGVIQGLPQMLRIRKLGHADGLELSTWLLMCVQFAAWSGYGVAIDSPAIWVTNVLTFVTTALVVLAIRGQRVTSYALVIALGLAGFFFVIYAPEWLANVTLTAFTASRLPQLVRTFINRNRTTATAVSLSALTITITSVIFWMAYSILKNNTLTILTTLVAMVITIATAALELRIAKRAASTVVA